MAYSVVRMCKRTRAVPPWVVRGCVFSAERCELSRTAKHIRADGRSYAALCRKRGSGIPGEQPPAFSAPTGCSRSWREMTRSLVNCSINKKRQRLLVYRGNRIPSECGLSSSSWLPFHLRLEPWPRELQILVLEAAVLHTSPGMLSRLFQARVLVSSAVSCRVLLPREVLIIWGKLTPR